MFRAASSTQWVFAFIGVLLGACKAPIAPLTFADAGSLDARVDVPEHDAGHINREMDSGSTAHEDDAGPNIVPDLDSGPIVPRRDSGPITVLDAGSSTSTDLCGGPGQVGGNCARGMCTSGLQCMSFPDGLTARENLYIPQAVANDPRNPRSFTPILDPIRDDDIPLVFATGSLCTGQCNVSAPVDMCGSCAKCFNRMGSDPLGLFVGIYIPREEHRFASDDVGICRAHCTFDPFGPGDCPGGHTCDPATNLCVESCISDSQCQSALVITEDGNHGTWRIPSAEAFCNSTTGRCDWDAPPNAHVGDACGDMSDCTEGMGACLRGGTCGEFQCNRPSLAPDSSDGVCDGNRGVCLGTGANDSAICIQGCNTSNDCLPGNSCNRLIDEDGTPRTAGSFSGFCFGTCDTVNSGMINGLPDQLSDCRSGEACDMPPEVAGTDPNGTCRPTCNPSGPNPCRSGETCVGVSGRSYGFCRKLDDFCVRDGAQDCYAGRICDNATGTSTLGRCVTPCTSSAQCTTGVCVTTAGHRLRGLCAEPCTSASCGTGRVCEFTAGTSSGYCVGDPR